MTKLAFWKLPSRNKKQQAQPETPPTTLRRSNATKRRTAPIVAARESSLYRAETSAYRSVSDGFTASHPTDPLYHLQENPSLFFPSPPPRLSVHWDHRHTDIWDDLFDYAETCRPGWNRSDPYDQPSHRTEPAAFTCYSQLDLSETAREKRTGLKESVLGLKGRFMRSEIWSSKVSNPLFIPFYSSHPRSLDSPLCHDPIPRPVLTFRHPRCPPRHQFPRDRDCGPKLPLHTCSRSTSPSLNPPPPSPPAAPRNTAALLWSPRPRPSSLDARNDPD